VTASPTSYVLKDIISAELWTLVVLLGGAYRTVRTAEGASGARVAGGAYSAARLHGATVVVASTLLLEAVVAEDCCIAGVDQGAVTHPAL
jgi:hypothetical protein